MFGADPGMHALATGWKDRKSQVLVFLVKSDRRSHFGDFERGFTYTLESYGNPPTIIELIDRAAGWKRSLTESYVFTMNYKTGEFAELLKAKDVLTAAKNYAKGNSVASDETYKMPISPDSVQDRIFEGSGCWLTVPVDESLYKLAMQWASSTNDARRIHAARMLGHFHTDESIVALKTFLKDNAHSSGGGVKSGRYVVERVYEARWAAWEALKRWDIKVERPVIFEVESDVPWPPEK